MLSDIFRQMSEDCSLLSGDMQAIDHEDKTGKVASKKSLEPTTRLRKTIEEAKEAEAANPNVLFINDKLTDIFGG